MSLKKLLLIFALLPSPAWAEGQIATGMVTGPLGLNTVPNARMDDVGTVRLGVSTLDPYAHSYLGFQLAEPLYIQLRQTAETSDLQNADRLYPGMDMKLRLMKETEGRPELSLGLQSMIGHKRMAGEYLAASKRYKDFDFTAGIGWGRFASGGHLPNPLKNLSDHFGGSRSLDGEMPSEPNDWFTGDDIGLFAGVEYDIPRMHGLSAKLDWGQDQYTAEHAAFNFDRPPPWSLGLSYKPFDWIDMGVAALGTDKIMARLSLTPSLANWHGKARENLSAVLLPQRSSKAKPDAMPLAASSDGLRLYDPQTTNTTTSALLKLSPFKSTPDQIGAAAIHMANNSGKTIEEIKITPVSLGLRGPSVRLLRKDFEQALVHHQGSPEEIWHHATFDADDQMLLQKTRRPMDDRFDFKNIRLVLEEHLGLSEEDSGLLTRTSLIAGRRRVSLFGFIDTGAALRLNLHNNLGQLNELRPLSLLPVRSNVDRFADNLLSLDEFYATWSHSFNPDLHLAVTGGYLEEMVGGLGGEILYRPFGKRYAFGAEAWSAWKRDPAQSMNMGLSGDHVLSGHVNAWYDIPKADLTLNAKLGRYLDEDVGGTIGLSKKFDNGATLNGYATLTNDSDFDLFGGTTHAMNGIRLTLPLGGYQFMPDGAQIKLKAEPFGRDNGQILENPASLYDLTEQFSYAHMEKNWSEILPKKKSPF